MPQPVLNAFTVDVEDYFHVSAFSKQIRFQDWHQHESRVVANTHRLLEILNRYQVPATFFVLGWVAERKPSLVREILDAGHEIGSHSYRHELIYRMTPEDFQEDLSLSCKILEDIAGHKITMFRAPSFSVTNQSLWALDILVEQGIEIDSSIYPTTHDVYGIKDAESVPHRLTCNAGTLIEFPGTVSQVMGRNIPVGGGGYFRIFPHQWIFSRLRHLNHHQQPFNFYIHPWEIDPVQPRIRSSMKSRFRHYTNLRKTEPRLRQLLGNFSFAPLSVVATSFCDQADAASNSTVVASNQPVEI